jgi:putative hydrolase of the HAD superfamily
MPLSPHTFDEMFERAQGGCPHASSALSSESDLFVCAHPEGLRGHCGPLWIFDADDTCWEDNIFYMQLGNELIALVQSQIPHAESSVLWELIHSAEHETIANHGFGPIGYERSLRRARELAAAHYQSPISIAESFFEGIVPKLSAVPDAISLDTVHTLRHLRDEGAALALFTMGVREIQQRKIYNSGLSKLFDVFAITSKKVPQSYARFIEHTNYQGDDIRMVGNSLKSDILPAITLGWKAYHYVNPNTWHAGNNAEVPHDKYTAIHSLKELVGA